MTFSLSARCPDTGMFGIAITSSSPAVAARCAWARAGVGVVATQNVTDPTLGNRGLDLMEKGASAAQALDVLVSSAPFIEYRQLAVIDAAGGTAVFCGAKALGIYNTAQGLNAVAAGNLLAHDGVPAALVKAFEASRGHLAARLLETMDAGLAAGGEAGPIHSAGLLVVDKHSWPVVDLRVDWADEDPLGQLRKVWDIYAPQLGAYVSRALDPREAPSYGVPGDL
ncbi:DUF1028 domain-containing protein [Oleomonas cavernae]|uniref:DUF1028 domain-containing protein n=1 Tax=Oleomonas cavernae TaxID=2320859 RepID=A0A418W9F9_9PROT|nr:DUF1028 domain-containing protein [Oleomonas cavernae]RJF86655.1 DUF1028 domain-containing protein [Oleomonas cavernae]